VAYFDIKFGPQSIKKYIIMLKMHCIPGQRRHRDEWSYWWGCAKLNYVEQVIDSLNVKTCLT